MAELQSFPKIGHFKTVAEFRAHLSSLALDLPCDDRVISAAEGSPLADPIDLDGFTIGNRWTIHPMEGWDGTTDGRPTGHTLRRWEHFGASGAKLIWGGEAFAVQPDGRANPNQLCHAGDDAKTEQTLRALIDTLLRAHRSAAGNTDDLLIGLQLTHSGRFCRPNSKKLEPRIAYHHPLLDARFGISPADTSVLLSDDDLERLIDNYVAVARIAARVGFHFVDVKHCHGYLGHELLSAYTRPGRFGGSLENRTRLLRTVSQRITNEIPGLKVGVRFSAFDFPPFRPDPSRGRPGQLGPGIPEDFSRHLPYTFAFGCRRDDPLEPDLTEPIAFAQILRGLGIRLLNVSAGSPYYNPHIQRPAIFPPSDGYQPPEDPLIGVARQVHATRAIKAACPDSIVVGTGYSYLQEYLPHVAQAVVRQGWADSIGIGRLVLSYWDMPLDTLAGKPMQDKRICRTFSDCTTAPRNGLISGCFPLDPHYKDAPEAEMLKQRKQEIRKALSVVSTCLLLALTILWGFGCAADPVIPPAAVPRRPPPAEIYDLVIRGGSVIDGSGKPAFEADVGIKDGRIAAVGRIDARASAREINATGLAVAPGFIDVHTHADEDVHRQPTAENFVRDGVTTIINGNCGGSVRDVGRYLARVGREGATVNVATLYGHNTALRIVKGDTADRLTRPQLEQAKNLVDKAMREGALGMSTGLIYNPGQFSSIEEIIELQRVAARHGGIYATHMRSEGGAILNAIDEALTIGRRANCRVQISHFKLTADASKKIAEEVKLGDTLRPAAKLGTDVTLAKVDSARAGGQEVWLDQYPYTASSTTINTLIPDPFVKDGIDAARRRLASDSNERQSLLRMMAEQYRRRGLKNFAYAVIASCPRTPAYNGRNILDITRANKLREAGGGELLRSQQDGALDVTLEDQFQTIIDIFAGGGAQCVFHSMDEADVENIMKSPIVGVASDSGIRQFGVGVPHPRGYGTNTRVLGRYAREKKLFSMEEAVRKMTSLPAHAFRLEGRGLIKPGCHADLVVFDPRTVIDNATFEQPHQYPSGIPTVIVNGVPVLLDGQLTGQLPGGPIYGPGKR